MQILPTGFDHFAGVDRWSLGERSLAVHDEILLEVPSYQANELVF
jgi:hypothetical protein